MTKYDFIKDYWKEKLIKHSSAHITLADTMLDDSTRNLLKEVGLPIILPEEGVTSFLPFNHLSKINTTYQEFYIVGDVSANLSGVRLLGIEVQSGAIYTIRKTRDQSTLCSFANDSLYQFIYCLAHYNILQEEDNKRVKEGYKETATQARKEYEEFKQKLIEIDKSALPEHNTGAYWNHILFNIRTAVESIEDDEKEGPYPPLGDDEDRFLDISREDLPF